MQWKRTEIEAAVLKAIGSATEHRLGRSFSFSADSLLFEDSLEGDGQASSLQMDSLETLDMILYLEDRFGRDFIASLEEIDPGSIQTVDDLVNFVGLLLALKDA